MSKSKIEPTEFQRKVLGVPETYSIFLGGGRGGGKSYSLAFLILRHVMERGGTARVLVTRRRLRSLQQFSLELLQLFKNGFGDVVFNKNDSMFTLNGGSTVQLAHCESDLALADVAQGMSFTLIIVDEAGQGPPLETIDSLGLSLRGAPPLRMILAANPGGPNHSALAERYVSTPWEPFEFAGKTWVYAPSTVEDNPHLPQEYRAAFEVLKKTDLQKYNAMRHGDWSAIVGEFFKSAWSSDMVFDHHELGQPFSDLQLGCDWGSAAPFVAILGGRTVMDVRLKDGRVVPKGAFVIFDEFAAHEPHNLSKGTGQTPQELAPHLIRLCERNEVPARGVIDASAGARVMGTANWTILELFQNRGVSLRKAPKGLRVPRFEKMKSMMVSGDFWVASRCKFWLKTVPPLPRCPFNAEDIDTRANDHSVDATSYLIESLGQQIRMGSWK